MHLRDQFLLDPDVVFLNHGSFGACPRPVLEKYQQWQRELERQPVEFLARRWDGLIAEVRGELGDYLGARGDDLVFVSNATTGMNVVARSLRFGPEDEVLTTDLEYGAVDFTWDATGARIVRAPLESLWDHVTEATRVLSVSHIASPTGAILPVAELCARARELGLLAVVDGAHAPGHVPVDLAAMGADAYAGNAHKWLCAPKGAGFLWARPELQKRLDPLVVSWGRPETEFAKRHEWQGTRDPAAFLSVPAAIEFQREWGWDEVRARCHALVERFVEESGLPAAATEFGQMVAVELPPCDPDVVQRCLFDEHRIEVPCFERGGRSLLRISVQGYNDDEDIEKLVEAMRLDVGALGEAVLEQPARTRQTRGVRGLPRRPPMTEIDVRAFDQYEAAGWQLVAGLYERVWSPTTSQAVDSLLDAAGVEAGLRVVDVGTGAGDAAGKASERGAQATGIDVAAAMVEIAAGRYPAASFVEASVTDLPFPDESFDAAVGNIVIQHVGEPERAAREIARVLVPGGRIALSTWDAPERSPFFAALLGAIADAQVPPPSEIPPGPSFFEYANDDTFRSLLCTTGFVQVSVGMTTIEFSLDSADDLITALADGTVRTGALLRAADEAQRHVVRESLEARLDQWRRGDGYLVPAPVKIASGQKPDRRQ